MSTVFRIGLVFIHKEDRDVLFKFIEKLFKIKAPLYHGRYIKLALSIDVLRVQRFTCIYQRKVHRELYRQTPRRRNHSLVA